MALFTLVIKINHAVQNHRERRAVLRRLNYGSSMLLWLIDFFLGRSKHIQKKAHAFDGRPTLKDVERQLRNGRSAIQTEL